VLPFVVVADRERQTKPREEAPKASDRVPRVSRHIQPLGPRVLVRIVKDADRSEAGLYLPEGAKESHAQALLGEVIEVARTMPKDANALAEDDVRDEEEEEVRPDLGSNVSGIPLGSSVLFGKERGITVPWDETLRVIEVRHILAIVDIINEDDMQ